jgi:hypothetical protein
MSKKAHLNVLLSDTLKKQFLACEELSGHDTNEVLKEAINFYLRGLLEIDSNNKILFTRPDGTSLWVSLKKDTSAAETITAPEKSEAAKPVYCCNCRFSVNENPGSSYPKDKYSCINEEVLKVWNTRDPMKVGLSGVDLIKPQSEEDQFDSISCDLAREERGYSLDSCGISGKFYQPKEVYPDSE